MLITICKECGKYLASDEDEGGSIKRVFTCPECGNDLKGKGSDILITSKEAQLAEDEEIYKLIKERESNDNGDRYSFEEVKEHLKKRRTKQEKIKAIITEIENMRFDVYSDTITIDSYREVLEILKKEPIDYNALSATGKCPSSFIPNAVESNCEDDVDNCIECWEKFLGN